MNSAADTDIYAEKTRRKILDFMKNEDVCVYLFGLRAKGTQRLTSDIGVAVCYKGEPNRVKIAELRELFEDAAIPYVMDIVDMSFAAKNICDEIRRDAVIWRAQTNAWQL